MSEHETPPLDVAAEIKKAIAFRRDGTYNTDAIFVTHLLSIINTASNDGDRHKDQLERMIFKYQELRAKQKDYFRQPNKNMAHAKIILRDCKELEKELDKKSISLLTLGYSIDRFITDKPMQGRLI